MSNDPLPPLKAPEFAVLLGTGERRARQVLGELEALGFSLEVGQNGARLVPAGLAAIVRDARAAGVDLRDLRLDPSLAAFLRQGQTIDTLDPLDVLVEVGAEVALVREALALVHDSLRGGSQRSGFTLPTGWRTMGLPDPRQGL